MRAWLPFFADITSLLNDNTKQAFEIHRITQRPTMGCTPKKKRERINVENRRTPHTQKKEKNLINI